MKAIQRLQKMIEYGFKELNEDETVKMRMDADALMLEIEQADETIERQAEQIDIKQGVIEQYEMDYQSLAAENARLKEALKQISNEDIKCCDVEQGIEWDSCDHMAEVAEQALAAPPQKGDSDDNN